MKTVDQFARLFCALNILSALVRNEGLLSTYVVIANSKTSISGEFYVDYISRVLGRKKT